MSISAQLQTIRAQLTAPGAPFELQEVQLDGQSYQSFKNAAANLAQLIEQGRSFGDKTFLVYADEHWSFQRFFAHVDALSAVLRQNYGITKGDRVAIAMRNCPEWMAAYAAIILSGAIAVPLNSWGKREELLYGLCDSTPKLLFCDAARYAHIAVDLHGDLAPLNLQIIVTEAIEPSLDLSLSLRLYAEIIATAPPALPTAPIDSDDLAMIMYTSGTSNHAKGVVSTHRAMCQGMANLEFYGAVSAMTSPAQISAMMTAGFEMSTLMAVPLFHTSGLHAQFLSALRGGRRIVILHKWDISQALACIAKERITQLSVSPAMMLQLLSDPNFDTTDTRSLSWLGFGGAGVPDKLIELLQAKKPLAMAGIGYGLTETNGPAAACTGAAFWHKPRSNGPLSPIFELRLCDEAGQTLPADQSGEIWLRSICNLHGYWQQAKATQAVLQDGWFRSGDIGYLDEEGFLLIVDRIKDIVNRGGEKIASAEIESCLLLHPAIAEAAAFGVPDAHYGEVLAVVVQPRPQQTLDAAMIRAHIAAHLATFKIPAHIVISPQPLPRNPSNKVLKRELRAMYIQNEYTDSR